MVNLATGTSLSEEDIRNASASVLAEIANKEWSFLSQDDKNELLENADIAFNMMEDDLFSYNVKVISNAYKINGKTDEIEKALENAKGQMKELSEKYSDYEHYPNLKKYYTTTSAFFEFCQSPSGSFEQVKDTLNDYKNEARGYINDLDYIFE